MFPPAVFQCTPNFSEGRDPAVVQAIVQSIAETAGACVIDWSADVDHNRSVVTFLATAQAVPAAAAAAANTAARLIDLRRHTGVHPFHGALDVFPVTPLTAAGRPDAIAAARAAGEAIAAQSTLPVYWYEWLAQPPRPADLPTLRALISRWLRENRPPGLAPDLEPGKWRRESGLCIVGARSPLVAWNVNIEARGAGPAEAIARRLRAARAGNPHLHGVRALGLYLESRGCAQVSMNITRPRDTPLPPIFRLVEAAAASLGVRVLESEVVGVIPRASFGGEEPSAIAWTNTKPEQVLEYWEGAAQKLHAEAAQHHSEAAAPPSDLTSPGA